MSAFIIAIYYEQFVNLQVNGTIELLPVPRAGEARIGGAKCFRK
jgi:hypothetical protein